MFGRKARKIENLSSQLVDMEVLLLNTQGALDDVITERDNVLLDLKKVQEEYDQLTIKQADAIMRKIKTKKKTTKRR